MRTREFALIAAMSLGAGFLTGCGNSSSSPTTTSSTTTTAPSAPATTAPTSSTALTVTTAETSYGTILTTGTGRTLYLLTADTANKSACTTSACTSLWPPLTVQAVPKFGAGVKTALFADLVRPSGAHQLTYGGHPIYTYAGDSAQGQTNGEGIVAFGGTWYVVSAATGTPVKSSTSNSSTSVAPYG